MDDKPKTKKTKPILLIYAILILSTIALLVGTVWTFYPYKTIDFKDLPYKTNKTVYKQGELGYYTVNYCKYTDAKPVLKKEFVDTIIFTVAETEPQLTKGCRTQAVDLRIPSTLPPGEYHIEIELTYELNPIRSERVTNYSNKFTVMRADDGAYGLEVTTSTIKQ